MLSWPIITIHIPGRPHIITNWNKRSTGRDRLHTSVNNSKLPNNRPIPVDYTWILVDMTKRPIRVGHQAIAFPNGNDGLGFGVKSYVKEVGAIILHFPPCLVHVWKNIWEQGILENKDIKYNSMPPVKGKRLRIDRGWDLEIYPMPLERMLPHLPDDMVAALIILRLLVNLTLLHPHDSNLHWIIEDYSGV